MTIDDPSLGDLGDLGGELRALFEDLGDAAGLPAPYESLRWPAPAGRRPIGRVALGLAAAGLVALAGATVYRAVDRPASGVVPPPPVTQPEASEPETEPTEAEPVEAEPTETEPVEAWPVEAEPVEAWPTELRGLLDDALPAGFVALIGQRNPLEVVAYDADGVRLEVVIDVDHAEGRAKGIAVEPPAMLSPAGDLVTADVQYQAMVAVDPDAPELAKVVELRSALPDLVATAGARLTGDLRTTILDADYPRLDSEQLRGEVDTALAAEGWEITGSMTRGAADFALVHRRGSTLLTVAAIRTDRSLPDGVVSPGDGMLTGLRKVGGWQLVVTASSAAPGGAGTALDAVTMERILAAIAPPFAAWRHQPATADACASHVVEVGDSPAGIAERYGVTLDDLRAANADISANLLAGVEVAIPCESNAVPAGEPPADAYLPSGESDPAMSFEATNGVVRSSRTSTYHVSGGFDAAQGTGAIRITVTTLDGRPVRDSLLSLTGCDEPTRVVDDLTAPLDALPVTCGAGAPVPLDVVSGHPPRITPG